MFIVCTIHEKSVSGMWAVGGKGACLGRTEETLFLSYVLEKFSCVAGPAVECSCTFWREKAQHTLGVFLPRRVAALLQGHLQTAGTWASAMLSVTMDVQ